MGFAVMAFIFSGVVLLTGCTTTQKGVNDNVQYGIVPNVAAAAGMYAGNAGGSVLNQTVDDHLRRSAKAAISGKLLLDGQFPTPLKFVSLGLYGWQSGSQTWNELSRLSTETDGSFVFTLSLPAGEYEVRVLDDDYKGIYKVRLTDSPVYDVSILATKK